MALNGVTWGSAVVATLDTTGLSAAEIATITSAWQGICGAHATHITTFGQVVVASVTLVQPGVGSSGPGTGTLL